MFATTGIAIPPDTRVGASYADTVRQARTCGTTRSVRVLVANCSVEYEGRLGARLPPAPRLIMLKADGSIAGQAGAMAVHADAKAYKPLNWMTPPCTVREENGRVVATNPGGEKLTVELLEV